jgi:hypothetical protein
VFPLPIKKYKKSNSCLSGNFENFKNYSAGMGGSESVILACPESFLFAVVKGAFFISI